MRFSLLRPGRIAIIASALVSTGLGFGMATSATPLMAAGSSYYTATLATPAEAKGEVLGGVAWTCQGNTCVAGKGDARPLRICRGLVRKFGEVKSFKTNGTEMTTEELAKCNGK